MSIKTYAQWHAVSVATGAAGLSGIVDASYEGDPAGTQSNKSYWDGHAYDVLEAIFTQLGSAPGIGVSAPAFTVNQDASTGEDSFFKFHDGTGGANPHIGWLQAGDELEINRDLKPSTGSLDVGASGNRFGTIYADTVDATSLAVGAFTTSGSTSAVFTIDSDDTIYDAGTGVVDLAISRGSDSDGDAFLRWDEAVEYFTLRGVDPLSAAPTTWHTRRIIRILDEDVITTPMLDESEVYGGSGGNWGTALTIARSDHSHSGGSLSATGTDSQAFEIDSDWASGASNVELRFGSASYYVRRDPNDGATGAFTIVGQWAPATDATYDLGVVSSNEWRDLFLSGDANIGTDAVVGGTLGVTGAFTTASTVKHDALFVEVAAQNLALYATAGLKVVRSGTDSEIRWNETSGAYRWEILDGNTGLVEGIATLTRAQTLSAKTLSAPVMTGGGSWSGAPSITGAPSFSGDPTFTGSPVFTADAHQRPNFYTTTGYAPFSITEVGGPILKVTNLDADKVDGIHGTALLKIDGSVAMTDDLDMGGNNITNVGSTATHQASHLNGGADEFDGAFSSLWTGTVGTSMRIGVGRYPISYGELLHLGGDDHHFISKASQGSVGIGGTGIDFVPGTTSGDQDVGQTGRRWRGIYLAQQAVFQERTNPPSPLENGSTWVTDANVINDARSKFQVRLGGSSIEVANQNNETGMTGATGDWTLPTGQKLHLTASADYYIRKNAAYLQFVTGGDIGLEISGSTQDMFAYEDFQLQEDKRLVFNWGSGSDTYIKCDNTGGGPGGSSGRLLFYVDGALKATLDTAGWS